MSPEEQVNVFCDSLSTFKETLQCAHLAGEACEPSEEQQEHIVKIVRHLALAAALGLSALNAHAASVLVVLSDSDHLI